MDKRVVASDGAPAAIGPYSAGIAVQADELVFLSGQIGLDSKSGELVTGGVAAQAARALQNLAALLDSQGLDFSHAVRATLYLIEMGDFAAVNEVYARFMPDPPPARATVAVAALPLGALVEIDLIAAR